jgi:histidyl-tRNA synthetase
MSTPSSKPSASFQAPTGTRDFYPIELARLRYIQDAWRRTSINHGFEEIDGPTFEHLDLYTVKSGEGIVSELFSFERFGGEKKYALRPEFTPTLARMYASKANSLPKPTKWFWMQNCYRAERPQRGRLREFCQWNCDIIGDDSMLRADTELLGCCIGLLEACGLTAGDVVVRISDREVIEQYLMICGVEFPQLSEGLRLLDARAKMSSEDFRRAASSIRLNVAQFDTQAAEHARKSVGGELLFSELERMGYSDWVTWDPAITRGLAYYTGMVFEVHEASGAERAIAGGGRYDGLIEMFGGPPTPAVGFGMGDVVLSLVLQDKGLMPSDDQIADKLGLRPDAVVISNGTDAAEELVVPTLAALRRAGMHARRSYKTTKNIGKLIQDAVKQRARYVVIIESPEAATVKNLDTQAEEKGVPVAEVGGRIRK